MLLAAALLVSPLFPAWHQVGPNPHPMEFGALPTPGRRRSAQADDGPPPEKHDRLADCLTVGRSNPDLAISLARHWLAEVKLPAEKVRANQCLGMMLSQQGDFDGALAAFGDAVGLIPEAQAVGAVPLMAMAGNAALAAGKPQDALTWLDRALVVHGFADNLALAAIQDDRARALVALNRNADAMAALAKAHELAPQNAEGWLLSATLHRREKDLAAAQHDIEEAARLSPRDPAVGVEAGVIAMLGQHEDAARQSWQSVVAMAPVSDEARVARGYLEQIGAPTTSIPAAPDPGQDKEITR
jgi:tetratricopeptide (TPR) repeat protein